ncbi:hypothetical protein ACI79P_14540 [Blastococcus sp. SYSU DS0510]
MEAAAANDLPHLDYVSIVGVNRILIGYQLLSDVADEPSWIWQRL